MGRQIPQEPTRSPYMWLARGQATWVSDGFHPRVLIGFSTFVIQTKQTSDVFDFSIVLTIAARKQVAVEESFSSSLGEVHPCRDAP